MGDCFCHLNPTSSRCWIASGHADALTCTVWLLGS